MARDWALLQGLQNSSLLCNPVDFGLPSKGFVPLWQCLGEHRCTIWLWLCRAVLPAANKKAEAARDTEALLSETRSSPLILSNHPDLTMIPRNRGVEPAARLCG